MAYKTRSGYSARQKGVMGKVHKPPLGSGQRFDQLEAKIAAKGDVRDPAAVAAAIGRKKYGKRKFQSLAAHGKPGY